MELTVYCGTVERVRVSFVNCNYVYISVFPHMNCLNPYVILNTTSHNLGKYTMWLEMLVAIMFCSIDRNSPFKS